MSIEKITALRVRRREDVEPREKLKGAADLDSAVEVAKEAGFEIAVEELYQDSELYKKGQELLSDAELEGVAGGLAAKSNEIVKDEISDSVT